MDDCNAASRAGTNEILISSDSSMDDCNFYVKNYKSNHEGVQIPLWTIVTIPQSILQMRILSVQIPLWTIVTHRHPTVYYGISGSDSSMDDCNRGCATRLIILLYLSSDSSMDDCNIIRL